jgi:hypothetical protein
MGHKVCDAEEILSQHTFKNCSAVDELRETRAYHMQNKSIIQEFYHSVGNCKRRRRLELTKKKFYQKTSHYERMSSGIKNPTMFIGDRGHGYSSSIKGHLRFGGFKKENEHGLSTPTIITNEYNTSQTCIFCFNKLSHPMSAVDGKVRTTSGTFVCLHPGCPKAFKPVCRDKLSALAIGLSGIAQLLFGSTFPCFQEKTTTESRERFINEALSFLHRKQRLGSPSDGGNTL